MDAATLKSLLMGALSRDLLIDLFDMSAAQAQKAFVMVRDGSGLDGRRARELVGHARFRMQEKGFRDTCLDHGGRILEADLIPGTGQRVYQPFMRFQGPSGGVILGMAAISETRKLPPKNMSRFAGVALNWFLTPRLDLDDMGPKPGDVFALFLIARDPADSGRVLEVAVGVVDSKYEEYVAYFPIEDFLAGFAPPPSPLPPPGPGDGSKLVRLKQNPKPFVTPGTRPDPEEKGDAEKNAG